MKNKRFEEISYTINKDKSSADLRIPYPYHNFMVLIFIY